MYLFVSPTCLLCNCDNILARAYGLHNDAISRVADLCYIFNLSCFMINTLLRQITPLRVYQLVESVRIMVPAPQITNDTAVVKAQLHNIP